MIIPIPVSYRYTNYPLGPKATALSVWLGIATSFVGVVLYVFYFGILIGPLLNAFGLSDDWSYGLGFGLGIAFIICLFVFKKKIADKIQQFGAKETAQNVALAQVLLAQGKTQKKIEKKFLRKQGCISLLILAAHFVVLFLEAMILF